MRLEHSAFAPSASPLRIVLYYALFGGLWILFSDKLMAQIVPAELLGTVSIAKGWFFIAVTAILLHFLIGRRLAKMAQAIAEARENEALAASEKRFRAVLENMPLIAVLLDLDGKVTFCNDYLLELTSQTREKLIGADWFDQMVPDTHPEVKELFLRGLKNDDITPHYENPIVTKDGNSRHIVWNNTVLRDADGLATGTASIGEDITERKLAEEKFNQNLRETTALHDLAQYMATDLTIPRIVDLSLAVISKIIRPDIALFFIRDAEELKLLGHASSDPSLRHRETYLHRVGECLCGLAADSGKPVYSINIHTDPRCTWDECKQAGIRSFSALPLLSNNQVFGVISLASKVVVDFEKQGSFLEALSGEIALGLKNALLLEEMTKHAAELEQEITERKKTEDELNKYRSQLEELVEERTENIEAKTIELERSRTAMQYLIEDINDANKQLEMTNEKLKEIDRLKSLFIASMSHELRTPLNSVIGFSSILLHEWIGPLNDEQKNTQSAILRSGKHLLSLINDIIDVSKVEAGKIEISIDDFDLAELLAEVEQTFVKEAQDRRLSLTVQALQVSMRTDRRRLLQCLLNLVGNAIKFTEQGEVKVVVRQNEERGEVTIAVRDSGIGIGLADQAQLFQAFYRVQSHLGAKAPGTGLGLYLTKKITVEILRGAISVTSESGSGSTFSITIPGRLEEGQDR
ncbi:MAG: ATP-binding protein [Geobacteraceae bacterium]